MTTEGTRLVWREVASWTGTTIKGVEIGWDDDGLVCVEVPGRPAIQEVTHAEPREPEDLVDLDEVERLRAALRAAAPTLRAIGDRTVRRLCREAMPKEYPPLNRAAALAWWEERNATEG